MAVNAYPHQLFDSLTLTVEWTFTTTLMHLESLRGHNLKVETFQMEPMLTQKCQAAGAFFWMKNANALWGFTWMQKESDSPESYCVIEPPNSTRFDPSLLNIKQGQTTLCTNSGLNKISYVWKKNLSACLEYNPCMGLWDKAYGLHRLCLIIWKRNINRIIDSVRCLETMDELYSCSSNCQSM